MYIQPLRNADPPIMDPSKLNQFIDDVFHNFKELGVHHRRLVEKFHEIQRDEHPIIRSVTAPMFDAALHFRDAYMEYIPNYPIAAYRIDNEMAMNPAFKEFVEVGIPCFVLLGLLLTDTSRNVFVIPMPIGWI